MRFLVTGAAGFIGSWLVPELRLHGHDVIPVDREDGDLRDEDTARLLIGEHQPDRVVHLAAQVGREFGEDDLHHTVTSNGLMTARVAVACAEAGVPLTCCSTSEVYGDLGPVTAVEGGRMVLPHNAYGLTKRHGEELAALYAPEGLQVVRLSMPYGPGLPAGRGRAALINFLWNAAHGEPLTVHRGSARSWCWVGDTVEAFRLVLERGEHARTAVEHETGVGIYNVGRDDNERPMIEVARLACDVVGASHDLIVEVTPPGRQTVVKRLSTRKVMGLGWIPSVDLEEGVRRTWVAVQAYGADGMPRVFGEVA